MEEKLRKQSIDRLDIGDNTIKILKETKIETLGKLCENNKIELEYIGISQSEINKIEVELQLLGLNLRS